MIHDEFSAVTRALSSYFLSSPSWQYCFPHVSVFETKALFLYPCIFWFSFDCSLRLFASVKKIILHWLVIFSSRKDILSGRMNSLRVDLQGVINLLFFSPTRVLRNVFTEFWMLNERFTRNFRLMCAQTYFHSDRSPSPDRDCSGCKLAV